jgi:hypothetical protein
MIMRTKSQLGISLLAAFLAVVAPTAGHADSLVRFFPEAQINGFYGDNIPLQANNGEGDWGTTMVAGFYLDYTSEARYASLHWDTFAQLFLQHSRFDRAGQGQFVNATDDENLSSTTKLRLNDFFYRDAPVVVAVTTSDQAPAFNTQLAQLILANDQATINHFNAVLSHLWGHNWSSELGVHQTTLWGTGNNAGNSSNTSFVQSVNGNTDYHFSDRFVLGAGYRFYDFQFTDAGRPDATAHWPYGRIVLVPMKNLYLTGLVGVVVTHTQGVGSTTVNPGGLGLLQYKFRRGYLNIYGGQQPELTSALTGVGEIRGVRGNLVYEFTRRVSGHAGVGFYQSLGSDFNGQLLSWGVGLADRLNRYMSVYARFVQVRVNETASNAFLPSGFRSGREEVGNYYVVGLSVSVEAFRRSWQ